MKDRARLKTDPDWRHAGQGDGEIVGTGIEISFTVRLLKGKRIGWPRLENDTHVIAVGNARPLDQALRVGTRGSWLGEAPPVSTVFTYSVTPASRDTVTRMRWRWSPNGLPPAPPRGPVPRARPARGLLHQAADITGLTPDADGR